METINHECYVSLEVAKLLEKVGFDWGCRAAWDLTFPNEPYLNHVAVYPADFNNDVDDILYAPTLDVAQRWLREVRHRSVEVKSFVNGTVENRGKWWIWYKYDFNPPIDWVLLMSSDCRYSTYEEAQEAGIKKALEMILKK